MTDTQVHELGNKIGLLGIALDINRTKIHT